MPLPVPVPGIMIITLLSDIQIYVQSAQPGDRGHLRGTTKIIIKHRQEENSMKRRYVARRFMARVLTVAMAASLVLQGASVPVYAAGDTDPESQGGGGH